WEGWAILLRQKQKKLIMLPSETMIWQPEFTDKTLSRKPGAVHPLLVWPRSLEISLENIRGGLPYLSSVRAVSLDLNRCFK
ncbi:hypothetical protein, partial [Escherichia coli]|uniref:hypothetical protein n=1 Tax=Escherichia coli TaxID=562 RepID=UPI001BC85DF1